MIVVRFKGECQPEKTQQALASPGRTAETVKLRTAEHEPSLTPSRMQWCKEAASYFMAS